MTLPDLSDATLLLVGHGSTLTPESAASVRQHAQAMRDRHVFGQVLECFWMIEPRVGSTWPSITGQRVFVLPVCVSEGRFTTEVIPRALGLAPPSTDPQSRRQQRDHRVIYYCEPVGTHPLITGIILERAAEAVASGSAVPPPAPGEMALFIAGHGTGQNPRSRDAIDRQVARITRQRLYREVGAVFLEEAPPIAACYKLARSDDLVLVPLFIGEGMHTGEDIPVQLGAGVEEVRQRRQAGEPAWHNPTRRHGKRVWCAEPVGTSPRIGDVIWERVTAAAQALAAGS